MTVRVLVVDDHQLFRDGVRSLFDHDPGLPRIEVVAEADRARVAYGEAARPDVDVVMLDIGLEGTNGLSALRELKRRQVRAPVLMVSTYADDHVVAEAFACGAAGYVHKGDPAHTLAAAVRAVAGGRRWCGRELVPATSGANDAPAFDPLSPLSPRERESFRLLVRGYSSPRLARELGISVKTAETHRTHIFKKLRVRGIVDLIRFAARHGLIDAASG